VLARLGSRRTAAASEPVAVAQAMTMLLAGRPAVQIAGELYVTLKAIEGHLAHAYAKLAIESRNQQQPRP
jgi:DNA-binding NarL/FixJ family response regulator